MPDVYVRLREAGLEDGEPIPADGTVTLSPVHVVDPDAWVTAAATVLHVRDGEAAPASVSAGRWRVAARSRSWERSWVLDIEGGNEPINLATLTPADIGAPAPWLPTEADMQAIRDLLNNPPNGGGGGAALMEHIQSDRPHPTYDNTPDLVVLFENGMA